MVWRAPLDRRLLVVLALLTIGSAPVAFSGSIAVMAPLLVITGLALAPVAITQYALIERLAPAGTSTEAYSWHITATAVGFGIGSAVAGALVEQATVPWALGSAAIALRYGVPARARGAPNAVGGAEVEA